ncbi:unknown protein [Simkania negevensis Z]|uniref:Uncharacterized protein n=1 Tax=Simkania negevensis (strain ATCC VR-1471 / DSM 27360 / Z) TaxID=331113 RepID=F8L949_SIMNZ|nr:unknown protein [Simkania negevensis Z]
MIQIFAEFFSLKTSPCHIDDVIKSTLFTKNLNSGVLSLILRDFSLSSQPFCFKKDHLGLPIGKNTENLRELSKQNKPRVQVFSKRKGQIIFIMND